MNKKLISYCFIGLLLITIITPTYYSLTEGVAFELVEKNSNDEEEKNNKKPVPEIEIKTYLVSDYANFFAVQELKKQATFFSKQYTSAFLRIDIPPPRV